MINPTGLQESGSFLVSSKINRISEYDLEIRKDTFWDTDRYIIFKDGDERAIKITALTLELYELCFDCFFHKYRRK